MNLFVDILFVHRTQLTHKTKFKRILAATDLNFHDAFHGIIGNEHLVSTGIKPINPSITSGIYSYALFYYDSC